MEQIGVITALKETTAVKTLDAFIMKTNVPLPCLAIVELSLPLHNSIAPFFCAVIFFPTSKGFGSGPFGSYSEWNQLCEALNNSYQGLQCTMKDSMSLVDIKISRTRKRWLARSLKIIHRAPWGCGADTLHPSLQVSTLSFHWGLGQLPVVFTVFDIRLAVGLRTVQYVLRNARLFPAALKSRSQLRSNFVRWVQFSPICLRYCLLQRHCNASSNPSDLLWQSLKRLGNVFQSPKQMFIVSPLLSFYGKFSTTQRDW